jgi:hypothetical protein
MTAPDKAAALWMQRAMQTYRTRGERAAMRCVIGDAAGLCDAIARAIEIENKGNHGKGATTKRGREMAAVAKRCGDAIWDMRKLVVFEDENHQ